MEEMTISAPCKINLSLDLIGKRPDGYHEIDTVMQLVSLSDTLSVCRKKREKDEPHICLECGAPGVPCDGNNIAVRCGEAFFQAAGIPIEGEQIRIRLEKRIPMMAGLGGGSADGAAVLLALDQLYDTKMTVEQLCAIGLSQGADIPFCVRGGTARARGIGEQFTDLPGLPDCGIVLVKPAVSIRTKDAFAVWDLQQQSGEAEHADVDAMETALKQGELKPIASALANVFEPLCGERERDAIQQVKGLLLQNGALGAAMSGSGSAVFGLFSDLEQAEFCRKQIQKQGSFEAVFTARPLGKQDRKETGL